MLYKVQMIYSGIRIITVLKIFWAFFLLAIVFATDVSATSKNFSGGGNFSDPTYWSGGSLPSTGDNITINGTCIIDNNVSTDNVAYSTLTIGGTSPGTLSWPVGGTNRLNVSNVKSTFAGSTLDMTNGGILVKTGGTWNSANLAFIPGTGTVELQSSLTLPSAYVTYNNLTINGSSILVSLGVNTTINGNLTDTTGTFDPGSFSLIVSGTTIIYGTLSITGVGGTKSFGSLIINGTFNNTANAPLTISGDFQNNGTYNGGTGAVTFTGASSNTISGIAASTAFNGGIIVNKGSSSANVLDVQSVITMPAGGLTLTNGTFKLSSASTITPFTADITTAPFLIPSTAGLWINGGTVSATSGLTAAGLIDVSNGTLNVGDAANESLISSWATIIIGGGVLNIAGRLATRIAGEGAYFTMSGGTLTVPTVGSTSATISPFNLDNAGSSFTMSGGTIVMERAGASNLGYLNLAGTYSVTGGTLQIGDAFTPALQTILINTAVPIGSLTLNGANSPTAQLTTNSLTIRTDVTITSGTLNTNNLDFTLGGNWTKSNTAAFTPGTGTVTFNGSGSQFINGTAPSQTFNNVVVSKVAGSALNAGGSTATITTNNFTETTGDFAAPATMNITAAATSSLTLTAGTYTAGTTTNITGNWTNNGGSFIPGANTVTFNGSGAQTINGTAATQTFYNIILALTVGQTLSVAGSTANLTAQDFTETTGNFTAGTAAAVSINGNLTITTGTYTSGINTTISGNLTNAGTYIAVAGNTISFIGAGTTTITGAGTFTIFNIALNKSTKTTLVDVQSSSFIVGINSGAAFNFSFTQGTWRHNTTATLVNCHNNGATTALTIPFNVAIEVPLGTMNLCKGGTNGNVILSGRLLVNGGVVKVMYAQAVNAGLDFRYKVNGGTPQLYISNGGDILVGAGFNANAATDYIDFNMSGAGSIFHVADIGYSLSYSFQLNNVVGGSTVMTGGTIIIENACNAALADIDMGGGNISPYTVTGGTVQFGFTGTQGGATWFGIQFYTATNYPNIDFQSGIAKIVSPYASNGQTLNVISISINASMTFDVTPATPDPNVVFIGNNGTFALSIAGTLIMGTGGVVFKSPLDQLITGTGTAYTFNNMTVNMTAGNNVTVGGAITTLNVANYTQTQGNYTPPSIFNVSGNWTHDAGTFNPGTNLVVFNGAGTQTINGLAVAKTFYNVTIAKTTGTLLTTGGSTATITTQNLTQTTGNFTAPATLNINGDLLLSAGTFTAGTTTNIQGNWTNNGGIFTPGTKQVNFTGTGTKTLGGSSATSFYNLALNTVAATDMVQLTNLATVTSVLNLTKGVLDLNSQTLSVTSGLTGAITRTNGYILSEKTDNSSKVKWNIGSTLSSHTYPFGTISGSYIPFTLNLTAGTIGNVTVSTYPTAFDNTPYPITPIAVANMYASGIDNSANTVDRFWQIDKDGATGTATMTFTATSAEVGTIMLPTAQRWNSGVGWEPPLPGQTSTATSATVPGVTNFSPWTLSSQSAMLPIQLVSFNAVYANPFVALTWVTESEINSDFYSIERTTDERTFETVCQVKAAGQSIQTLNYQAADKNPSPGISYYRLKQVDIDGKVSYSDLVAIEITTPADQITISPNPVTDGKITIQIPNHPGETIDVSVIDMGGKILYSSNNKLDEAQQSSIVIDRLGKLPKGLYILRISGASEIFDKKITIY